MSTRTVMTTAIMTTAMSRRRPANTAMRIGMSRGGMRTRMCPMRTTRIATDSQHAPHH